MSLMKNNLAEVWNFTKQTTSRLQIIHPKLDRHELRLVLRTISPSLGVTSQELLYEILHHTVLQLPNLLFLIKRCAFFF